MGKTISEFEAYLKPLAQYQVSMHIEDTDDGFVIIVRDEDIVEVDGHLEDYSTHIGSFYIDREGTILFIEHPYSAITMNNYQKIQLLCGAVGKKIILF